MYWFLSLKKACILNVNPHAQFNTYMIAYRFRFLASKYVLPTSPFGQYVSIRASRFRNPLARLASRFLKLWPGLILGIQSTLVKRASKKQGKLLLAKRASDFQDLLARRIILSPLATGRPGVRVWPELVTVHLLVYLIAEHFGLNSRPVVRIKRFLLLKSVQLG